MTKKHFIQLANMIKERMATAEGSKEVSALVGIAKDMADMFQAENSRFDRCRFLSACGVK